MRALLFNDYVLESGIRYSLNLVRILRDKQFCLKQNKIRGVLNM